MKRLRIAWRRFLRSRHATGIILLLVLLVLVGWWLAPRRVEGVVTVDGKYRWNDRAAPPRRQIVWQPAEQVVVEMGSEVAAQQVDQLRPQLTGGGSVLYFTRRQTDGTADIYASRWTDDGWGPAKPVTELNSPANDGGAVLSVDGSDLFLSSDRPDGQGGFDLYHSRRTADGWSDPKNLGPIVNTPAHEYDPAIDADGTSLLFASNRTRGMHRHAQRLARRNARRQAGDDLGSNLPGDDFKTDPWPPSLQTEKGLTQFDLYLAHRDIAQAPWDVPEPLQGINQDDSNEDAPYLSANGVFLYFASDRPNVHGTPQNYDLYRGRIDVAGRRIHEVVNLGADVNSPANETQPALSPEGFRVLFASDRVTESADAESSPLYSLYSSTAVETESFPDWDTSRWSQLVGWLSHNWRLLPLLLMLSALVAAVVWLIRQGSSRGWFAGQWSFRRLPVPGFLLVAVALHLLLATGSFFIYFGQAIVEQARTAFEEVLVASNLHQSHEAGQESYEKVADLQSLDAVQPTEVTRQVTEAPRVNVPTDSPIASLPTKVAAESAIPQRAVDAAVPVDVRPKERQIERRNLAALDRTTFEASIELEQTHEVQSPSEEMSRPEVAVNRQQETAPQAIFENPDIDDRVAKMQPEEIPVQSLAEAAPATVRPSLQPPLKRIRETLEPARASEIAIEPTEPVEEHGSSQLASLNVQVDRQTPAASSDFNPESLPSTAATPPPQRLLVDSPTATANLDLPSQIVVDRSQDHPLADARRRVQVASDAPAADAIETLELGDAPEPEPSMLATTPSGIDVDRQMRQDVPLNADAMNHGGDEPMQQRLVEYDEPSDAATSALPRPESTKIAPAIERLVSFSPSQPDRVETEPMESIAIQPAEDAEATAVAGMDVGLERSDKQLLEAPVRTPDRLGGVFERRTRLTVGSIGRAKNDAPPAFDRSATRLDRRPARAPLVLYAEDDIGLQSMLRLRGIEIEDKKDLIQAFGGKAETLAAVERGLTWIEKHQHEDGHWSLHRFHDQCQGHKCNGHGSVAADAAATGLALLPMLGDGHTHQAGRHQKSVEKGLRWLIDHQKEDGDLYTENGGNAHMYSHGIAAIALCEAYGMSRDVELREPAQRAIDFIVEAQHEAGGWRYHPKQPGDTSVMGWQIMALKSGQMADLNVPQQTLDQAGLWLRNQAAGKGNQLGRFGYQSAHGQPAMTAEALLCLEYLGAERTDPHLTGGVDYMLTQLPKNGQLTSYYWYYGTQVMYHMQGDHWNQWNGALNDVLLETQIESGPMAGTWDPRDNWEKSGGRIYATSLRLLMLEVYYRHLPLYQALKSQ